MRKKRPPDDPRTISEELQEISELWKQVHVDLQRAVILWSRANGSEEQRAATKVYLITLMRLLEPFGDATLTLPMLKLIGALDNLEDGLRPPWLKPGKPPKGGRPGRSLADVRMATGSALVTVLHEAGRPVSEAEAHVARHMTIDIGSLRSWRKQVTSNRKNPDAVKVYTMLLSECRKYGGEHAVERILKNQF